MDRAHFNVMNGDQVVVTASVNNAAAAPMVTAREGSWTCTPGNYGQVDFGATRNIKRLVTGNGFTNYNYTGLTVETSDTGLAGSWTTRAGSITTASTGQTYTLDSAVDVRYVRFTPTGFQLAPDNRWIPAQMRIFGDAGTFDPGIHLDVISNSAVSGGVTATRIGSVSYEDGTTTFENDFANDDPAVIKRKILYNLSTGDGFSFGFTQDLEFARMGIHLTPGFGDSGNAIKIGVSSDGGGSYTPVYQNYSGSDASPTVTTTLADGLSFFDLTPTTGNMIKFEFVYSQRTDNRISDVMVFQSIPEPATLSFLALGGLALLRRRRR